MQDYFSDMEQTRQHRHFYFAWFICGIAALFYFYQYFPRVMPSVMASQLVERYRFSPIQFANFAGAYYYIYIPMQLLAGLLLDRFIPQRLLALALLLCVFGSFLFANTFSLEWALLSRLFIGLGSAFAFVGVLKIASVGLPENRFALVTGITTSLGMLGGLLGDVSLTSLINRHGWQTTNNMIAIAGIFLSVLLFIFSKNIASSRSVPNICAAYQGLRQLMKNPQMWLNSLIGCLLYIPVSGFAETWGISYLMAADHLSKTVAADAISMIFLGWVCGAPLVGLIADYLRNRCLLLTIAATASTILLSIILYVPGLSVDAVFFLLFLFGLFSSAQVLVFSISRELSPPTMTATAVAMTNMVVMVAGGSISLIGFLLNLSWRHHNHAVSIYSWDYPLALFVLPLSLIVALFFTFYLRELPSARSSGVSAHIRNA